MANLVRAAALLCLPSVAAAYSTMPACAGSSVRRCLATRSSPIRCADLGDEPQPLVLIATDAEVAEWDSEYEALDEWLEREEEARMMLVRLGSKTTSAEEKATIVDTLLAADASERDALLDVAISLIDRSERQRLARRRLRVLEWIGPLGRIIAPRRRIIGRYRRLLDDLESREPGSGSRFSGEASARRRRFLVLLLRQARGAGSIADVEREALRSRSRASMAEMLARTPAGLETPTYEVISSHASWEVREYDEFAVCTTAAGRVVSADPGQLKLNAPKMPAAGAFQATRPHPDPTPTTPRPHPDPTPTTPLPQGVPARGVVEAAGTSAGEPLGGESLSCAEERRLKAAQAICQAVLRLGEALPPHAAPAMHALLVGARDEHPAVRSSCLACLADVCATLRFSLHPWSVEILAVIHMSLTSEPDATAQQAAAHLLALLLRQLGREALLLLESRQLKALFAPLRRLRDGASLGLTRAHASAALDQASLTLSHVCPHVTLALFPRMSRSHFPYASPTSCFGSSMSSRGRSSVRCNHKVQSSRYACEDECKQRRLGLYKYKVRESSDQ